MTTMIALIGEQPLPNFLPVLHYKPDFVVLVYTIRTETIYKHLKVLLEARQYIVHGLRTGPYDVATITEELNNELENLAVCAESSLVFNLTGGTKTMSFAAYQIAAQYNAPVLYFQSESGKSIVDHYLWQNHQLVHQQQEVLPEYLQLHDMLDLHLGPGKDSAGKKYWEEKGPIFQKDTYGHLFELAIAQALHDDGYEAMRGVIGKKLMEIDVVIGYRNQVGIIEAKTSQGGEVRNLDGIKQLSTAMRSLRGTYVKQFLVIAGEPSRDLQMVSEVLNVHLISLLEYKRGPAATSLSLADKRMLLETVNKYMKVE